MNKCSKDQNAQLTENFVVKVVQPTETIGVRHGLMLVGPTGGGKTANFRLLQQTSVETIKAGDSNH